MNLGNFPNKSNLKGFFGPLYQDVMAVACFFGNVDLLITMTTNPDWTEIKRELLPGQTAYDCPDLVACVFKLKKDELIQDIYKRHILGSVSAYIQ